MNETLLMLDIMGYEKTGVKGTKSVRIKKTGHEKSHYVFVLFCVLDSTKLNHLYFWMIDED